MIAASSRALRCTITPAVTIALLLALLASCTAAAGRLVLDDATATLDRGQLEAAAAPLIERGAVVAVFVTARGDEQGTDFGQRLGAAGLLERDVIAPAAIALYVSLEPRYSELRAGTRWSGALPDATLREVRLNTLNPALREGQFSAGAAATLQALDDRLSQPPLGEHIKSWLGYAWLIIFPLMALWLFGGERLGRLWRRSPPGRLAQWLWDKTPGGQRKLQEALRIARLRMENRVEYARSFCQTARSTNKRAASKPIWERLTSLDDERKQAQQTLQGRALLARMEQLAYAYEALGRDAEQLCPPRRPEKSAGSAGYYAAAAPADTAPAQSSSSSSDSTYDWSSGSSSDTGSPSSDGGSW